MNENDIVELLTGINQQAFALTSALDRGIIEDADRLKIRTAFAAAEEIVAKYLGCKPESTCFYGYDGKKLETFTSNPGVAHTPKFEAILSEVKKEWKIIEGNEGLITEHEGREQGKNTSGGMSYTDEKNKGSKDRYVNKLKDGTGGGENTGKRQDNEQVNAGKNEEVKNEDECTYFCSGQIHVIGHKVSKEQGGGLLAFVRGKGPSELEKGLLSWVVNQLFTIYQNGLRGEALKVAGVKSAIGSIMARNGSHNIGSHVLAALSHNVSTMPEDRRLYRYIQHRMDYIATATTEFPAWRQPTLLVGTVLKNFLSQVHLLDYISRGEGLGAYRYDGNNERKNKIRFHIRRMNEDGSIGNEFIGKDDGKDSYDAMKDVTVAIPGGVIGHHAVYTVIENILRNAAKHEWLSSEDKKNANLDIHIDFTDQPERGLVELTVWSGQGPVDGKTADEVVKALNGKLGEKLVARGTKTLKAENWGLAEMRIAAGYLVGAPIEQIAGIEDDIPEKQSRGPLDLISAVVANDKKSIGYRFNIPKPKELLIVLGDDTELDLPKLNQKLVKYGVYIKKNAELVDAHNLSYSYVIVDDDKLPGLPIRVIGTKVIGDCSRQLDEILTAENDEEVKKKIDKLLSAVHTYWLLQVLGWDHDKEETAITLSLDVKGGNAGTRKSLVTQADLLYFVLENSIDAMLRDYVSNAESTADETSSQVTALLTFFLLQLKDKNVNRDDFKVALSGEREVDRQKIRDEIFKPQIEAWLKRAKEDESIGVNFTQVDESGRRYMPSAFDGKIDGAGETEKSAYIDDIVNFCLENKIPEFWKIVESYLNQAESVLIKDDAQVATLPIRYGRQYRDKDGNDGTTIAMKSLPINVKLTRDIDDKTYCYWRHGEGGKTAQRYLEPLSGSQSYIGHLEELEVKLGRGIEDQGIKNGLTRLAENAMIKMLIIDERVNKFAKDHSEVKAIYDAIGIKVGDETVDEYIEPLLKVMNGESGTEKITFDENILVIHQGILDKLSAAGKLKAAITEAINNLQSKDCFKYVIITTGRGIPVNIPDNTRVLPFSIIESTLFRRYPEKMPLTDAILNLLPIKRG